MNQNILNWISKLFKFALLSVAILYIIKYLFIVYSRINYPFELEWMEGGLLAEVRRIMSGEKLYVEPSIEYVPFMYAPLYFYLSAAASVITGVGFLPMRLVSFISSLGCLYVIFLIVRHETGSKYAGILASCLFAASFPLSGGWFDVARVDMLFMVFILTALYLVRTATSSMRYVLAGVFLSLSFFTKQNSFGFFLPVMFYCFLQNWRKSIFLIGPAVVGCSVIYVLLNYINDGWFHYYVFGLSHDIKFNRMFAHFWKMDILSPLPIAFIMSVFYLITQLIKKNKDNFLFYFLTFIGMMGGACLSRIHPGSGQNVVMPAYAIMAILFGMAFHVLYEFICNLPEPRQNLLKIIICSVFILQFTLEPIRYSTSAYIPNKKDMEAGMKLIDIIKQLDGEVFNPDAGYLSIMAGKKSYAHGMAIRHILILEKGEVRDNLFNQIKQSVQEKRFNSIIVSLNNGVKDTVLGMKDIEKYYMNQKKIFESENVFWPVLGLGIRPEFIYVPKEQ